MFIYVFSDWTFICFVFGKYFPTFIAIIDDVLDICFPKCEMPKLDRGVSHLLRVLLTKRDGRSCLQFCSEVNPIKWNLGFLKVEISREFLDGT